MTHEAAQPSFRALAESSADGVFVHDGSRISYVNPALLSLLGFHRADELVGRQLESIVYADDVVELSSPRLSPARPGQLGAEIRCVARDGGLLAVRATGTEYDAAGARSVVVVVRDVTRARNLEDSLRRSHEELEVQMEERTAELRRARATLQREAGVRGRTELALQEREEQLHQALKMEAVGRLAGGIAHDFNNLLSVILSYGQLMQIGLPRDNSLQEPLGEITRAAERAAELTHQLLAFSRRQVLEPKVVDPTEIVAGLDKMLRRIVGEDLHLSVIPGSDVAKIRIDPNQLEQVVVNLVINARDAMPDGGQLTIEMANVMRDAERARDADVASGQYVMLAISDTGTGIDDATINRIFEPFFTTKARDKGTGLGLSIVYGVVKQCGGHISVRSAPGQGTSLKLYFPAVTAAAAPEAEYASDTPVPPRPGAVQDTVLVVEDAGSVLSLIRTILRRSGYNVLTARTPRAALELGARHAESIALLVTDVVMPQMSGPKLAQALQQRHPELRVMYLSGYTDDTLQHHGVLSSTAPFLHKPFTPDTLLQKVRQTLGR